MLFKNRLLYCFPSFYPNIGLKTPTGHLKNSEFSSWCSINEVLLEILCIKICSSVVSLEYIFVFHFCNYWLMVCRHIFFCWCWTQFLNIHTVFPVLLLLNLQWRKRNAVCSLNWMLWEKKDWMPQNFFCVGVAECT